MYKWDNTQKCAKMEYKKIADNKCHPKKNWQTKKLNNDNNLCDKITTIFGDKRMEKYFSMAMIF